MERRNDSITSQLEVKSHNALGVRTIRWIQMAVRTIRWIQMAVRTIRWIQICAHEGHTLKHFYT